MESFDFQWQHLCEGSYLLSDQKWRENVSGYILDELQVAREDVAGKFVLDAGCGNGRWAYGFEKLGCRVYGFDTSRGGIEYARQHVKGRFDVADILDIDCLLGLYQKNLFDIVWCWGVLHHTGDPERALENIARFVKQGGIMHLYLYGKKGILNRILRYTFNRFTFEDRVALARILSRINHSSVHSNFDAFSPTLASQHDQDEAEGWLRKNGFTSRRVYPKWAMPSRDLFVTGVKLQT